MAHDNFEEVYVAAGATALYKEILLKTKGWKQGGISWKNFIDYIFETVLDNESLTSVSQTKLLENTRSSIEYEDAPTVFGGREVTIGTV